MRGDFIKRSDFVENTGDTNLDIFEEIEISKKKLNAYYENMNFVRGSLIDYYVYQIKAEQAKFAYLMKEAKKQIEEDK